MVVIWFSLPRTASKKSRYVSNSISPTKMMVESSTVIVAGIGSYHMMPCSSGVGVGSGEGVA